MEEDKARKDLAVNSVGGISRVTPLQVKSEGHPMTRKKREWRSEGKHAESRASFWEGGPISDLGDNCCR